MNYIDAFLNRITMYKLVLYGLIGLLVVGGMFGLIGTLSLKAGALLTSTVLLVAVCYGVNSLLAWLYKAPVNSESALITALILACILPPVANLETLLAVMVSGVIAMASKYVLAYRFKHVFNPAAFAAMVMSIVGLLYATWWVGSAVMLPFTLLLGFLVVRKIRRFALFWSFLATSLLILLWLGIGREQPVGEILSQAFTSWPIVFFGTIMLTEPLTTPPTKTLQIGYGVVVGVLFASQWDLGFIYANPQTALILGNILSFALSSKQKPVLRLKEKIQMAPTIFDYVFTASQTLHFHPGQYIEWTLPHKGVDMRGNRRYFTIASSPTENEVHLGVKFYSPSSSFKSRLASMQPGDFLYTGHLMGDLTLPKNPAEKLLFIAGGIGITPFRSMLKYLIDTGEKRDIVLIYAISNPVELVYKDVLAAAEEMGVRVIPLLRSENIPADWTGKTGTTSLEFLAGTVPDFKERRVYISGPPAMVDGYSSLFKKLGVARRRIVTDYFSGY